MTEQPGQDGQSEQQPGQSGQPGRYEQYGPPAQPYQQYGQQPQQYGPPQQQYQQYAQYGGHPQAAPSPTDRPTFTLGSLLGARTRRRPEARFGSALAGAGAALTLAGAFVWSAGYFAAGFGVDFGSDDDLSSPTVHGTGRRFLGFGLFLVLALLGYAVVILRRRGPLATAGTVLSAIGVPLALGFVFLDVSDSVNSGAFPLNIDAVYLISIAIWLVSYLAIPGARGRAFYLAAAALALPSYVAFKSAGASVLQQGFSVASGDGFAGGDGPSTHTGTVAALTLVFGLVYYLVAAVLDRAGRGGVAVALLYPAFTTTATGIVLAAHDFGQVGTGATLVVIGVLVSLYAGRAGRRFTTWVWAAAAVAGIALMVAKLGTDRYATVGILLLVLGVAVVAAATVASTALHEQPDVIEEPAAVV